MNTSHLPESWDLMNRGTDPVTGQPMCHVRRVKHEATDKVTVWRLVLYPNGWRNRGQFIPHFQGFRPTPERHGVKLSNSRIDLTLKSFAEHGHGVAYA